MIRQHLAQLGRCPPAAFDRDWTARMKYATRRRVDRARHLALDGPEIASRLDVRIGYRHSGKEHLGIGVERVVEQLVTCRQLDDVAEIHDRNPLHPYTQVLLAAVPVPDPNVEATRDFRPVQGEVPSPINPPSGCVFHPRCPIAVEGCRRTSPELREVLPYHWVACSEVRL